MFKGLRMLMGSEIINIFTELIGGKLLKENLKRQFYQIRHLKPQKFHQMIEYHNFNN